MKGRYMIRRKMLLVLLLLCLPGTAFADVNFELRSGHLTYEPVSREEEASLR